MEPAMISNIDKIKQQEQTNETILKEKRECKYIIEIIL